MHTVCITVPVADIYKDHAFTSEVVTQGFESEELILLDNYNNWSKVEQWDGYKGWINNFYLGEVFNRHKSYDLTNVEFKIRIPGLDLLHWLDRSFSSSATLRKSVIEDCEKFLGIPYKWGGKTPFGFDCSGLIQTVFRINGILMPRDSKDQYEILKENKIDSHTNAKSGDLLFFKENESICHVAIFNKNMKFIHSSGKVRENSLAVEDYLFDKKLMDKFIGIFSMSEIIKEQLNGQK